MITCCNLISGCIATYFAFQGFYDRALIFIIIGAVFDFFDGMTARLLHVSSPIGKELDSLADDITFGFAPSAILFSFLCSFSYHELPAPVAFAVPFLAFLMAAFSALRLAKFNLDERQTMGFIGLPTPANALFWGALITWLDSQSLSSSTLSNVNISPSLSGIILLALMFLSCYLLVAELPLFALKFKHWGWKGNEVKYIFLISSIPLLLLLGTIGLAVVIAWYVILSIIANIISHNSQK